MKLIEGFEAARAALARRETVQSYPVSPALKRNLKRMFGTGDPEQAVRAIVEEVRTRGDAALIDLTFKIDRIKLASLEVSRKEISAARKSCSPELIGALKLAAERVRSFHAAQKAAIYHETSAGACRQVIRPLERVGIYVPGGTATYPSTVLMTAIPARVAGVKEIVLATPPKSDGEIPAPTLAAAAIAGVDRVFRMGGAQAIAALAYGTKSVPAVDKICGPGNIFVVLAKKMVYGAVDIDGLQGPSEVLIVADESASAAYCAADLLAQAEHDSLASAILVTTSRPFAGEVRREITRQLKTLPRREMAGAALKRGMIAVVGSLEEAIEVANLYGPEHLCLMLKSAGKYMDKISNAGCVVLGREGTVVLGDYAAGPSHVLPTGGTARFSSPLSVSDFIKFINTIKVDSSLLKDIGPAASTIARAEGLEAHARAIETRLKKD